MINSENYISLNKNFKRQVLQAKARGRDGGKVVALALTDVDVRFMLTTNHTTTKLKMGNLSTNISITITFSIASKRAYSTFFVEDALEPMWIFPVFCE